jgi:hypothetical protein
MIDKGDNFDGPSPGRIVRAAVVTSAVVSAIVAALTALAVEFGLGRLGGAGGLVPEKIDGALGILTKDEVMVQEGHETSNSSGEHEVYYPVAFPAIPNLSFPGGSAPTVMEQRKDGFKYSTVFMHSDFKWRAAGLRNPPK